MEHTEHEMGTVIRLEGDLAVVRMMAQGHCESCAAKIMCRPNAEGAREMSVYNGLKATVGQVVEIDEVGAFLLQLGLMQFGLPLLGLVGGILLFHLLLPPQPPISRELLMTLGGVLGVSLGGFITWLWARNDAGKRSHVFQVSRIIGSGKNPNFQFP